MKLQHNNIEVVPSGLFAWVRTWFQRPEMQRNKIRIVETGAFDGIDLYWLPLSHNEIEQFPWDDMRQFPNLNQMSLAWNNIESLPESREWTEWVWVNRWWLELELWHNKIKTIPNTWSWTEVWLGVCFHDNYLTEVPSEDQADFQVTMTMTDIGENNKNKKHGE